MVKKPRTGEALLHLIFANMEELIRDIKLGDSLGCSGHDILKFSILTEGSKAESRITTLYLGSD